MSKVFVDTNVLLYGLDPTDDGKRSAAEGILRRLDTDRKGVISTQVMQEFYVGATKKMRIPPLTAKSMLASSATSKS